MTFVSALALLRRGRRALLVGLLLGLVLAGAAAAVPGRYAASAGVYVSGLDVDPRPGGDDLTRIALIEQRVSSYRALVASDRVLGPVATRLGGAITPGTVTVDTLAPTSVFAVTAVDPDPARATVVAAAVADRYAEVLREVERTGVKATVVSRPVTAVRLGWGTGPLLVVGATAGLLLAAGWVLARGVTATRRAARSAGHAGTVVGDRTVSAP